MNCQVKTVDIRYHLTAKSFVCILCWYNCCNYSEWMKPFRWQSAITAHSASQTGIMTPLNKGLHLNRLNNYPSSPMAVLKPWHLGHVTIPGSNSNTMDIGSTCKIVWTSEDNSKHQLYLETSKEVILRIKLIVRSFVRPIIHSFIMGRIYCYDTSTSITNYKASDNYVISFAECWPDSALKTIFMWH